MSPHWIPSLGGERHWCVQDLIGADLKPVSHIVAALSPHQKRKEFHTFHISATNAKTTESLAKRSNNALNGAAKVKKYCSNAEVSGTASERCGSPQSCVLVRALTCAFCRSQVVPKFKPPQSDLGCTRCGKSHGRAGPCGRGRPAKISSASGDELNIIRG